MEEIDHVIYLCELNDGRELKAWLENDGDYNMRDKYGNTPLHYAVGESSLDCAEILLERGADPNSQNEEGYTPLHYAFTGGSMECIKMLLVYGADATIQNNQGQTFLGCFKNDELKTQAEECIVEMNGLFIKEPSS